MIRAFLSSLHTRWAALVVLGLLAPPIYDWPAIARNTIFRTPPAIEVLDGVITNPQVTPGEPLSLKFTIVQRAPCEGTVDRIWFGQDGTAVYKQRIPFAGVAVNGDKPVVRAIKMQQPAGLGPGHYTIRSRAKVTCDDRRDYVVGPVQDMPFDVIDHEVVGSKLVVHKIVGDNVEHQVVVPNQVSEVVGAE